MKKGEKMSEEQKRKIINTRTKNNSYVCLPETRKKISESESGSKHWNWGGHHSKKTRKKLSLQKMGNKNPQFGKHVTEEHKEKMRIL